MDNWKTVIREGVEEKKKDPPGIVDVDDIDIPAIETARALKELITAELDTVIETCLAQSYAHSLAGRHHLVSTINAQVIAYVDFREWLLKFGDL